MEPSGRRRGCDGDPEGRLERVRAHPGEEPGRSGSVEQSNDVTALAVALNLNETCQALMQEQTGNGSDALQVAGQGSWDDQRGGAWSRAIQGGKKKHNKR